MIPNFSQGMASKIRPASLILWIYQCRTTWPLIDTRAVSRASISISLFGEDVKTNKGIKHPLGMDSYSPAAAWAAAMAVAGCGRFDRSFREISVADERDDLS
jgi:hypothetical protein